MNSINIIKSDLYKNANITTNNFILVSKLTEGPKVIIRLNFGRNISRGSKNKVYFEAPFGANVKLLQFKEFVLLKLLELNLSLPEDMFGQQYQLQVRDEAQDIINFPDASCIEIKTLFNVAVEEDR